MFHALCSLPDVYPIVHVAEDIKEFPLAAEAVQKDGGD
jgi:hypothetical protein